MSAYTALALAGLAFDVTANVVGEIANSQGGISSGGTTNPVQYGQTALFSVSVPASGSSAAQIYVFDCVYRGAHRAGVRLTEHPVQTGSVINSNGVLLPIEITLEIGMSDAPGYSDGFALDMWSGSSSKSIAAYQTMLSILQARQPLQLTTRLMTYQSVILIGVEPVEDPKTRFALRANLVFRQLITASIGVQAVSARPQTTGNTTQGQVSGTTPSPAVVAQHEVDPVGSDTSGTGSDASYVQTGTNVGNTSATPVSFVPGGGTYTSGNVSTIGSN